MSKAQKRSAALTEKFWFRKNISSTSKTADVNINNSNSDAMYTLMSIDEIINGKVYYSYFSLLIFLYNKINISDRRISWSYSINS